MATSYLVCFNSGSSNQNNYQKGDNVSLVSINNSDQEYFQNGTIQLYNVPSTQSIGDTCKVWINGTIQFGGYISRRQQTIDAGVKFWDYQLIGKTYDLWRYHTDSDTIYTDKTTAYIASSLVGTFCTGISGTNIDTDDGVTITGDMRFDNEIIGDALVRLTEMDGYKFFVDNEDKLDYYELSSRDYNFTVTEDNILEMTSIEDADEDIVNDVLVVGSSDYTTRTEQLLHDEYKVIPSGVSIAQKFKAEGDKLSSVMLYLGRTTDPNQPTTLDFEIWGNTEKILFTDDFDNQNNIVTDYNIQTAGGNLILDWTGDPNPPEYQSTGYGIYKCFSGQVDYDCQYMKVTLSNVVSSNNIGISGSNNSGGTWSKLTDGEWHNFGSLDYSPQVMFAFNSSGDDTWTPKIGYAECRIIDDTGGSDVEIFDDTFDNLDFLSSNSNMMVYDGKLELSGSISEVYPDSVNNPPTFTGESLVIDGDDDSYSLAYVGPNCDSRDFVFTFNTPVNIRKFHTKIYGGVTSHTNCKYVVSNFCVSSADTDGWVSVASDGGQFQTISYYKYQNPIPSIFYKNVKKVKTTLYWNNQYESNDRHFRYHYFYVDTFGNYDYSGNIKTSSQSVGIDMDYLKISPTTITNVNKISYSGSCDGGANWTSITPNINTPVGNPGSEITMEYVFKPSSNYAISGLYLSTPSISRNILRSYVTITGGIPKSGTKLEFSDDISITASEVVYPPSYSSWQTYTGLKLRMKEDDYYWMVLSNMSGSSKYWNYYYDVDSTYNDGKIVYSWDDGVKWSTNGNDPTQVPAGDMCFKLGWVQGLITYTSSNTDSISTYGRHFKKITDSNVTSEALAKVRATYEVSSLSVPKKGSITIEGREDMSVNYKFSSSLVNFGISDCWDVVSYTQTIDKRGFSTLINYGRQPFDFIKKISELERSVY